jgi:hypothetical protein
MSQNAKKKKKTLQITIVIHNANGCGEKMFSLHLLALYFSDANPILRFFFISH